MTGSTAPSDPPSGSPAGDLPPGRPGLVDHTLGELRRLRRSREGRVVAGVCAGVSRHLDIDPVVVRLLLVVLTLFSGAGLVLYVTAWLFVPKEGRDHASFGQTWAAAARTPGGGDGDGDPAAGAPEQRRRGSDLVMTVIVLVVAYTVASAVPIGASWWGPILLLLTVLGFGALSRRRLETGVGPGVHTVQPVSFPPASGPLDSPHPDPYAAGAARFPTAEAAVPTTPAEPAGPAPVAADVSDDGAGPSVPPTSRPLVPEAPPRTWTQHAATPVPTSFWNQADPLGLDEPPPATAGGEDPPAQVTADTRQRPGDSARASGRLLLPVTAIVGALLLGTLSALDSGGVVDLTLAGFLAAALAVVGAGLLVGTWYGRPGGLIAIGLVLAVALPVAELTHTWQRTWPTSVGDRTVAPTSLEQLRPRYDNGVGEIRLDLNQLDFADSDRRHVEARLGMGDVYVDVPAGVDVAVTADIDTGGATVFGEHTDGTHLRVDQVDQGADGPGGGHLRLVVEIGAGELVVRR